MGWPQGHPKVAPLNHQQIQKTGLEETEYTGPAGEQIIQGPRMTNQIALV